MRHMCRWCSRATQCGSSTLEQARAAQETSPIPLNQSVQYAGPGMRGIKEGRICRAELEARITLRCNIFTSQLNILLITSLDLIPQCRMQAVSMSDPYLGLHASHILDEVEILR